MSEREIVLCSPVRTAVGAYGGSLKGLPAPTLGAAVIRETLRCSALDADRVQEVVMGNVIQAGIGMNPARQAAIGAGLPIGAAGAILATRLMYSMRRGGLKRGVVSLCIGGGLGIALALESL